MARYFFDLYDHTFTVDKVGSECADIAAVRKVANGMLTDVARDAIPIDAKMAMFVVLVRDEASKVVYTATLTFSELWVAESAGG